ncbi:Hypothetical predicted protein [Paramuricea clavata]|uniref:Uncharacterized protein n=1 Tax=Paramuricea clavata TaxID=317549 RepID=A0A6S7FSF4_PARCT|nr:Hypothetical predicted protein [Paramuricea clavata]
MDVTSYLHILLANEVLRDKLIQHFQVVDKFLSHPACTIIQQIKFDVDLIEVSNEYFSIKARKFIVCPITEAMHGKLSPRSFVPPDSSKPPKPGYFWKGIVNSFPDDDVRVRLLHKLSMDWKLCIICQRSTKEALQCPARSKRKDAGAGYFSFIRSALGYRAEIGIEVTQIDIESPGIEQTLTIHNASWHKSCRDLYNNTKLERAKKRKLAKTDKDEDRPDEEPSSSSPVKSRRSSILTGPVAAQNLQCFFCDKQDSPDNLHCASTLEVDRRVRDCARLLNDSSLIAKLSTGDLIAMEAKYHANCLASLYNKTRPIRKKSSKSSDELPVDVEKLAFAELIAYIEDILEVETAVLTLSELVRFYQYKLKELEADCGKVNSTRLKERVLKAFSDLTAHAEGRETNLVSRHVIGDQEECQKQSIPASLLTLIGMLIKGPSTKSDPSDSQSCISIAQLVVFNSVSRYEREEVVCPSQLRKGLFTTSAVDNIDNNTSSTTTQTSFHGTAISLVPHPNTNNQGTPRATDTFDPTASTTTKTIAHLPSSYTEIAPMTQPNGDLYAPRVPDQSLAPPAPPDSSLIDEEND